jgi:hypothetical protein
MGAKCRGRTMTAGARAGASRTQRSGAPGPYRALTVTVRVSRDTPIALVAVTDAV